MNQEYERMLPIPWDCWLLVWVLHLWSGRCYL